MIRVEMMEVEEFLIYKEEGLFRLFLVGED